MLWGLIHLWCFYIMRVWTRAEYRPDRLNITVLQQQKRAANRSHFSMMLQSAGDGRVSVGRERWSGCGKGERESANEGERFGMKSKNGNELERMKELRFVFKSWCQIWCLESRMVLWIFLQYIGQSGTLISTDNLKMTKYGLNISWYFSQAN